MTIIKYIVEHYIDADGYRIIPVVRISISYDTGKSGIYFSSFKYPVAVVLVSSAFQKVFRITGEEISVESLWANFPGINKYIDEYLKFTG